MSLLGLPRCMGCVGAKVVPVLATVVDHVGYFVVSLVRGGVLEEHHGLV